MAAVAISPREEERKARERQRQFERLQRAAMEKREREARSRRAAVIREELAKPRARRCRCGITSRTTLDELVALGAGCTAGVDGHGGFVCPVLDAIRRRLGR